MTACPRPPRRRQIRAIESGRRDAPNLPDGQPDVSPAGYEYDGTHLYVGGMDPVKTRKFRNVQAGNAKVAIVIDDLVSRYCIARHAPGNGTLSVDQEVT